MPLLKNDQYTSEDYWNLPEGTRAELIDGKFYDMAPPSRIHQRLVSKLTSVIDQYISNHHGNCQVYPAPFAVNLDADDRDWVEPDISVICNPNKLTDRGCSGAPDLIIEIVSPSKTDVREYWIVDPLKERVTVYYYEEDAAPTIYTFMQPITVGIYKDLTITIADLLN